MGIYDRDYYRVSQPSGIGRVRMWSVTTWLIIINIAVFVLDAFLHGVQVQDALARNLAPPARPPLEMLGYFSIATAFLQGQVWRVITCQFLHVNLMHLAMNMIVLWLFGPIVEFNLRPRRFAYFYLLCGIAGPVMYTVLWAIGILAPGGPAFLIPKMYTPLVGASAGIFGVMLAAAHLAPDRRIYFFFLFELQLKYFVWGMMIVAAYTVFFHGNNAGGEAAHLGGGLLGWFLIRSEGVLDFAAPRRKIRGRNVKDWSRDMNR